MSFASETKCAICRQVIDTWCCKRSELAALLCFAGNLTDGILSVKTEHACVAKRLALLFEQVLSIPSVELEAPVRAKGWYSKEFRQKSVIENIADGLMLYHGDEILLYPDTAVFQFDCCARSFLRGAFLGGGTMTDPEKTYHLEFVTRTAPLADELLELLTSFEIPARLTVRKNSFVVYIKESEAIADLLGLMGAGRSMMELYNIKIERDLRNRVNRQVNCDNANLDKITDASQRHIEAIDAIKNTIGLEHLTPPLQQVALLRLENPELSLKELGSLLNPPIGKSGVNHRLNKIVAIADSLLQKKGTHKHA